MIKWLESYNTGIKEIDNQHKGIVDILNRLYNAFIDKEANNILNEILDNLLQYADYHFKTEEKYFHVFKYEEKEEHIKEHKDFVIDIKQFYCDFKTGKAAVTYKIMTFLGDWLLKHINGSDQKYIKCFRKNGLK